MSRTLKPFSLLILLIGTFFFAPQANAFDTVNGTTAPNVVITKDPDGDYDVSFSGQMTNPIGVNVYHDAATGERSVQVYFEKLTDPTSNVSGLTSVPSGAYEASCTVNDNTYAYSCPFPYSITQGTYAFAVGATSIFFESFMPFTKFLADPTTVTTKTTTTTGGPSGTQTVGGETYQVVTPIQITTSASNPVVTPQITITNPADGANYRPTIGTTTDGGTTCTPIWQGTDDNVTNNGEVKNGVATLTDTWPRSGTAAPGTYCIGLQKNDAVVVASFGSSGVFTIGSVSTTPTSTGNGPTGAVTNAYGCTSGANTSTYCMLAPIPIPDSSGNIDKTGKIDVTQGFGNYIGGIIKLITGLIGVLAVFMVVAGGIEYMTGTSIGEKEGGKNRILNALGGLLLALSSFIILNTINPNLTNLTVTIPGANVSYTNVPSSGGGTTTPGQTNSTTTTTTPPGSIPSAICNAANAYQGTSTASGPGGGTVACAWAVNNILTNANVANLDSTSVSSLESALTGGRGSLVAPSSAVCGDIVVQAQDGHVGVCLNSGCTQVISNSSSKAAFTWISDTTFAPSYTGGVGRIYQVNS